MFFSTKKQERLKKRINREWFSRHTGEFQILEYEKLNHEQQKHLCDLTKGIHE